MLNLARLNISSLALTSLTPKEDVNAIHKQIEEDTSLQLLYGMAAFLYGTTLQGVSGACSLFASRHLSNR